MIEVFIYVSFKWYDFWIGFYYDVAGKILYFCPIPCICVQIEARFLSHYSLRYCWNMFKARILRPYWEFRSICTPCKCGNGCDWVYPYGFVPEADCSIHDR